MTGGQLGPGSFISLFQRIRRLVSLRARWRREGSMASMTGRQRPGGHFPWESISTISTTIFPCVSRQEKHVLHAPAVTKRSEAITSQIGMNSIPALKFPLQLHLDDFHVLQTVKCLRARALWIAVAPASEYGNTMPASLLQTRTALPSGLERRRMRPGYIP